MAVDDVSFAIGEGETFGLVGESGSGKTTTGRCVLRLVEPASGEVFFRGENVLDAAARAAARDAPAHADCLPGSVWVVEPADASGTDRRGAARHSSGRHEAERRERVAELLTLVGLDPSFGSRYPHEFSGGQRQRIGVARAIALNPSFIVADEPVSALDVSVQAQVVNLLMDLQARFGLTYLFIAHDLRLVEHICSRVAVMYRGRIVEMGATRAIFTSPRHPYTQALLSAVPSIDPAAKRSRIVLDPTTLDMRRGIARGCRRPLGSGVILPSGPRHAWSVARFASDRSLLGSSADHRAARDRTDASRELAGRAHRRRDRPPSSGSAATGSICMSPSRAMAPP